MTRLLIIGPLVGLALLVLLTAVARPLPGAEEELVPLFNGMTLDGWRGYKSDKVPEGWTVEEKTIKGSGQGPDLMTKQKYADFELQLEWKISPKGNSGIVYRISEEMPRPYETGPEYHIIDDVGTGAEKRPTVAAAALYGLYGSSEKQLHPVGEFNQARIIVRGNRIQHWLNGTLIVDCVIGSEDWNTKVAASKFRDWKRFAKNRAGHISLQAHGSPVWFRNLKIKKLAERQSAETATAEEGNQPEE